MRVAQLYPIANKVHLGRVAQVYPIPNEVHFGMVTQLYLIPNEVHLGRVAQVYLILNEVSIQQSLQGGGRPAGSGVLHGARQSRLSSHRVRRGVPGVPCRLPALCEYHRDNGKDCSRSNR
ncbi:unnamed protein product [Boreogadus saida]